MKPNILVYYWISSLISFNRHIASYKNYSKKANGVLAFLKCNLAIYITAINRLDILCYSYIRSINIFEYMLQQPGHYIATKSSIEKLEATQKCR